MVLALHRALNKPVVSFGFSVSWTSHHCCWCKGEERYNREGNPTHHILKDRQDEGLLSHTQLDQPLSSPEDCYTPWQPQTANMYNMHKTQRAQINIKWTSFLKPKRQTGRATHSNHRRGKKVILASGMTLPLQIIKHCSWWQPRSFFGKHAVPA